MSHFSCMVIGGEIEEQLAPYDESKRLDIPVITGEVSEEDKQIMIGYYKEKGVEYPTFDELYAEKGENWNCNLWVKRDDKWVKMSDYNPQSKWDWYKLGGRWSNFLKLKEGAEGTMGETIKKNIDVDGMRNDAEESAGIYYDKVMSFIKDTPIPTKWSDFIERVESGEITIEIAKILYNEQPRLKSINTNEAIKELGFMVDIEEFEVTREEYSQKRRNSALSTYAIVKDGEWFQKGEMGWWGMLSYEMTQEEWDKKLTEMFDELPDDTLISIIDCHI